MKNRADHLKRTVAIFLTFFCLFISCCTDDDTVDLEGDSYGCMNEFSFNYSENATIDDGSCSTMHGCVGFVGNLTNSGQVVNSFGDPFYDSKMNAEVQIQSNFFQGIPANVYVLIEPGFEYRNAYATSDGNILFGYYMHQYILQRYGELPIAGVLAHEWGHITQYTLGWQYDHNEYRELEADAFSGFYMALAKQYAWSNIQSYYANVYATGDYNFNHPSHHGTPNERLAAAYLGVQMASYALQNGVQFNYQELHSIFIDEIENRIAPRRQNNHFEEICYPENLTKEYIESLYPTID